MWSLSPGSERIQRERELVRLLTAMLIGGRGDASIVRWSTDLRSDLCVVMLRRLIWDTRSLSSERKGWKASVPLDQVVICWTVGGPRFFLSFLLLFQSTLNS